MADLDIPNEPLVILTVQKPVVRLSNHPWFLEAEVLRPASNRLSNDQVMKEADLQIRAPALKKGSLGGIQVSF